ncbi:hypothetical protein PCANC_15223 [Puccinia coronata f. sp. avenae]|uniref:Uncharacterized protein n=1 Tax=Puccinia coronata f. sp. avenae TaxID=200324 RepID=A0A2N5VNL4_9BASI|nr:hypothetical protein PCASD_22744 [Puccinia coronata f. sp. avenae]PLW50021.1 hypothetical protein PCASD_01243 [Puccinia coronata f. sp. avenae]PLW51566.1 hypothetical protein PCANC_15223 [Puccinia coronata f. sp. avenae]
MSAPDSSQAYNSRIVSVKSPKKFRYVGATLPGLTGQTGQFECYVRPVIGSAGSDRSSSEPVGRAGPITGQTRRFERCLNGRVQPVNAGTLPALTGRTGRVKHRSNRRVRPVIGSACPTEAFPSRSDHWSNKADRAHLEPVCLTS